MPKLENQVAMITGAASPIGFGFITARLFAQEGASVVLTDIRADEAEQRALALRSEGFSATAIGHDVTSKASWDAVIARTLETYGRLDILINNAGIAPLGSILTTTEDSWDAVIAINLKGVFLGCQAAIRQMKAQGGGGSVVNISSSAGISALPNVLAYTASKGGVRLLTKAAALDVANSGIRVNSVHPGQMKTEMAGRSRDADPELMKALLKRIPMEKLGEPEDIARMNLFLASSDAQYITGAEFAVDGGSTAGRTGS
jgi:NAD(P)-dependent dehydrogenase (short-subunit alcohol dehydrogenase family)